MSLPATASQTAGPYWHLIDHPEWADLLRGARLDAERVVLTGRVTAGEGAPCTDVLVELFQAGPDGRHDGAFHGFGRCATDTDGFYRFVTVRPGAVRCPGNQVHAPHATLTLFARGLLRHLTTRLYFPDESLNATDPVLCAVPAARRGTLLARPEGAGAWRLDIRLQGEGETVFLEV